MTAASLSHPSPFLPAFSPGNLLPRSTHSRTASLILSLLLLNVLADTPPLYMISCIRGDMFDAKLRQK